MFTDTQIDTERASRLIENIENDLRSLRSVLGAHASAQPLGATPYFRPPVPSAQPEEAIEGIFDGEKMVDENDKAYQVSPNYASKSKLVEGDPLKLYITGDGKFFYKQLGPVERTSVPGVLRSEGSRYVVDAEDGHSYNILTASVTYYMSLYGMQEGARVTLMIPSDHQAQWAVIDNML